MRDLAIAIVGGAAVLLLTWIARTFAAHGRRQRTQQRALAARTGELDAVDLLCAAGFAIETEQARHAWTLTVNGEPRNAGLRCDYLATRDGERWVAEVKTGREAPQLGNAATRRQLLEYQVAYGAAGVALVDATAGIVHEVVFDLSQDQGQDPATAARWPLVVIGIMLGLVAGTALATIHWP